MNKIYKNLPKTSQQLSDEADRASRIAFTKHGFAPYDQDNEESDEIPKRPTVDDLESNLLSNEDFIRDFQGGSTERAAVSTIGSVVVDHEMVIPPEISRETEVIIGKNPLDDYHETRPEDSRLAS